jgi:diketogulonate reductase-like aldo/keto reductase
VHIDTAAFYFSSLRSANELINTALAPYPDDLVIVTKVGPGRDPWGEWYAATPEQLRGQVEENLRQLGRDHLDVVNLRRMRQDSITEHFGALAVLRDAGLIQHLGLSDVTTAHLAEALAIAPVVCVQNRFSLEVREHEDVLRACREQGIAFVPFFAIAGERRASGGSGADTDQLLEVARWHGATPAQVRLAWTLQQGPTSWPSPAPATPVTSPRTSPPTRCASPNRTWPFWTPPPDLPRREGSGSTDLPSGPARCLGRVPDRREAAARPAGVSGLRYLPAVQNPLPDTFIGTNDADWGRLLRRCGAAGISSGRDPWKRQDDHDCQPAQEP